MYELIAKKKLEENGWIVSLTDMPQRFKKSQDFFGIFDIIALKAPDKLFIQVKYNCGWRKGELKKLSEFKEKWLSDADLVQLWDYQPGKGWKIDGV